MKEAISALDAKWLSKAAKRTEKLRTLRAFQEKSSIWSDIKPILIAIQRDKCAYCERKFEGVMYGKIEYDVEHFRPKNSVPVWPDSRRQASLSYSFATGDEFKAGYWWLAYDIRNYAAACKVCNTIFKLNFFPIAGRRCDDADDPAALAEEEQYLCNPIGDDDADPETLISFVATTAVPAVRRGPRNRRGRVIIDFFGLNIREILHRERAQIIALFGGALEAEAQGAATAEDRAILKRIGDPAIPHAACLRSFYRLWTKDEALGRRTYNLCRSYAVSNAGTTPPDIRR
ncbi:hypothetical protein ACQR1I_35030 [Bradyrhizobium sp. HKCCYLS2038]|uniref:hypothetical protein n=1 Tax=unclassified Bradyrhizobium TaxID=2631580 RepID=UPI003EC081DE